MTPTSQLEIRSENSGTLTFTVLEVLAPDDIHFRAELEFLSFKGAVTTYTFMKGPPSRLFSAINESWRGWTGEKSWDSIDGSLELAASMTSTGHVTLRVEMRDHYWNCRLSVPLMLEGGSIQRIAADAKTLFEAGI